MEQVSGLNIRNMADADMAAISEIDQKLATREAAWQQKASSHLGARTVPLFRSSLKFEESSWDSS